MWSTTGGGHLSRSSTTNSDISPDSCDFIFILVFPLGLALVICSYRQAADEVVEESRLMATDEYKQASI